MTPEQKHQEVKDACARARVKIQEALTDINNATERTGYALPLRVVDELNDSNLGSVAMVVRDHTVDGSTSDKEMRRHFGLPVEEDADQQ